MSDESFKDFVIDQLRELPGFRARSMFGGFGLYAEDCFFAILMEGRLYFRTDDQSRVGYLERGMAPFVYEKARRAMTLNYFEVPPEILECRAEVMDWARTAIQVAATRANN